MRPAENLLYDMMNMTILSTKMCEAIVLQEHFLKNSLSSEAIIILGKKYFVTVVA